MSYSNKKLWVRYLKSGVNSMSETVYFDSSKIVDFSHKNMRLDTNEHVDINEQIYELYDYLPLLYSDESEKEYIENLFCALKLSYSNRLYQFAYIQLHMIFMVCIYYMLLQVNEVAQSEMEKALYFMIKDKDRLKKFYSNSNTKNSKLYFGSFACLGESEVFLLLKIIGLDSDLQGELAKLVEERNKYAHANGNITITSQSTIDENISKYINTLERVYNLLKPEIEILYKFTLSTPEFYDSEIRQYYEDDLQIEEEFVRKYFISQRQLNVCRKSNVNAFSTLDGFGSIKNLHIALSNYYKNLFDEEIDSGLL